MSAVTVTRTIKKIVSVDPIMFVVLVFSAVLLVVSIIVQAKNTHDVKKVLEGSVKQQLLSTAFAAREFIDVQKFVSYNSLEDASADSADYNETLAKLRDLAHNSGAAYIYAVKKNDGRPIFVFDTDEEAHALFEEYEDIAEVHERAFKGEDAVGIMNVQDEWGNFSTSAIPILDGRRVIGIISVDIEDTYIKKSQSALIGNAILQISIMGIILLIMLVMIYKLVAKVLGIQRELERMANYDTITKLPNRQYLMDYLRKKTETEKGKSFAVMFIDLDNFKKVNDNAGHDAGDALLVKIGNFLQNSTAARIITPAKTLSFRISAGMLNIAARVGGDEFIHIVSGIETEAEAKEVAKNLFAEFDEIRQSDEIVQKYDVGLSVGVALYPKHSENFHVLIKYADVAMYKAKKGGKNNYAVYSVGMDGDKEYSI